MFTPVKAFHLANQLGATTGLLCHQTSCRSHSVPLHAPPLPFPFPHSENTVSYDFATLEDEIFDPTETGVIRKQRDEDDGDEEMADVDYDDV